MSEADRRSEISYKVSNGTWSMEFEFKGDARDFGPAIVSAANSAGGDIRPVGMTQLPPAGPSPSLPPTSFPSAPTIDVSPIAPLAFTPAPIANPSSTNFNLPTLVRSPRVRSWVSRGFAAAMIGATLAPLWLIFNSPVAQSNLKRIWSDATTSRPQPTPIKKSK